jgi:hypothetical protein
MNHIRTLIIFILIAVSCSSGGKKEDSQSEKENVSETNVATSDGTLPVIKIRRPSGKLPALKLSEIADDIRYIKLETHNDALLDQCRIFRSDNSPYMFALYQKQIYKFDATGKYIKRIGQHGQGPNEFTPHFVTVDFEKEFIYVFPGNGRYYLLKLDFDGNILKKIENELVFYPSGMMMFEGELIFLNDPISPISMASKWKNKGLHMQLYMFNPDSNRVGNYLPNFWLDELKDKKFSEWTHAGKLLMAIGKGFVYYKFILNDTVYRISNKEIKPYLIMDIEKNLSLNDYLEWNSETLNGKLVLDDAMAFKNYLMLWFTFIKDDRNQDFDLFLCLYDLVTGKLSYHDYMVLNDLDGGPNWEGGTTSTLDIPQLKNPDEQFRKFYLSGHDGLELKFPERKDELKKLVDISEEDDNPIIRIISLKDDF